MQSIEEMFLQGFQAMQNNDNVSAQAMFHEILKQDAGHFGANYLVACEEAHSGDYAAARAHFTQAMVREPMHVLCRFQAGLLELSAGDLAACAHLWSSLEVSLPDGHYVKSFVQGCLAMGMDRFDEARQLLRAGLAQNQESPSLNRDMEMVLAKIDAFTATGAKPRRRDEAPGEEAGTGSTLAALNMFQLNKTRH